MTNSNLPSRSFDLPIRILVLGSIVFVGIVVVGSWYIAISANAEAAMFLLVFGFCIGIVHLLITALARKRLLRSERLVAIIIGAVALANPFLVPMVNQIIRLY